MKLLIISVICLSLVLGITSLGYCPGGSSGGGGAKGGGSYSGQGGYKVGDPINYRVGDSPQYKAGEPVIDKTNKPSQSTTLGQELMDLEAAYKKGIITEEQYNRLKNTIIDQRTEKK